MKKEKQGEEDGSYQTLKLAMETDEKRKSRMEKIVATTVEPRSFHEECAAMITMKHKLAYTEAKVLQY